MKIYIVTNIYLPGGIRLFRHREDAEACLYDLKEKNWADKRLDSMSNPVQHAKVIERDLE